MSDAIVGLTGPAGSGKTTTAEILIDTLGYVRLSLADPMREALLKLDPYVFADGDDYGCAQVRLSEVVGDLGWDAAKRSFPEVRRLLRLFGTEVGREMFGQDIWVDRLVGRILNVREGPIVIDDVRFHNEAAAIKRLGGVIWRVERPGVEADTSHASERGIDMLPDGVILNDGTIEQLAQQVVYLAVRDWIRRTG